ncbi:FAD/NADP-binding domain-containing protein [Dacryopinax primogenitus]|uniref:FAD/NADP-binding domain-containing protein n=1 Tax=Dacryopinax primogenitus (strain DJM 731) TaxID=1858805 RepID=M5G7H6_DACPD|nr:FAD/NADP-binding domain-containing protein [Dacryopinax primogenitus]EJT99712.1 FAD/NADP-binding domain-containing protein [Dacryopinax primogenitus]
MLSELRDWHDRNQAPIQLRQAQQSGGDQTAAIQTPGKSRWPTISDRPPAPSAQNNNDGAPDAPNPSTPLRIAIVGGGIVGLCLALALHRHSLPFTLYESASKFSEIGAGLMVGWNALQCLEEVGVAEEVVRLAMDSWLHPPDISVVGMNGTCKEEKSGGDVFFQYRFGDGRREEPICTVKSPGGQITIHRADLLDLLLSHLPEDRVRFRKHLVQFEHLEYGVWLEFSDGTKEEADVLLAADGIRSTMRRLMYARTGQVDLQEPRWSGCLAYRALVPSHLVRAAVGDEIWGTPIMWLEPSRHVVHYPVAAGEYVNFLAYKSDYTKGRAPKWDGPWVEHEVDEHDMLKEYEGCGPQVRAILELVERPSRWAMYDIPDLPYFVQGNVALLGDAARAMTPHIGNGASQGIEDVHVLAHLLAHPKVTRKTVSAALKAYELVRKQRAQRVKELSWCSGRMWDLSAPGVGDDAGEVERVIRETMDWVWGVDIVKQLGDPGFSSKTREKDGTCDTNTFLPSTLICDQLTSEKLSYAPLDPTSQDKTEDGGDKDLESREPAGLEGGPAVDARLDGAEWECPKVAFGWGLPWDVLQAYYKLHVFPNEPTSILLFLGSMSGMVMNPVGFVIGKIADRYGYRLCIICGTIFAFLAMICAAFSTELWQFFLTQGVLQGLAIGCIHPVVMSSPSQWFRKKRELATGIVLTGASFGGGVASFCVQQLLIRLFRLSLFRDPIFWSVAPAIFFAAFGYLGFNFYLQQYTIYRLPTLKPSLYAVPLSAVNFSAAICRSSIGFLADKIGVVNTFIGSVFMAGFAQLVLWNFADNFGLIILFAIVVGFFGAAFVSLTSVLGAKLFGVKDLAALRGLLIMFMMPGNAAGPPVLGAVFAATGGNWHIVFSVSGVWCVTGACCLLYARFKREPRMFAIY